MKFATRMVYPPITNFDSKVNLFGEILVNLFYKNVKIQKDQFDITVNENSKLSWVDKKDSLFSFSIDPEEIVLTMSKDCPEEIWQNIIRTYFTEAIRFFSIGEPKYIGFQFTHDITSEEGYFSQMLFSIDEGGNSLKNLVDTNKLRSFEMKLTFDEAEYRLREFFIGEKGKMNCIIQIVFENEFVNLGLLEDIDRIKSIDEMHFKRLSYK